MFVLGSVAALDITQRWIRINDSDVTKIFERDEILGLVKSIEPSAAKRKRAKVLVDNRQQLSRFGNPVTANRNTEPT